MNFTNIEEIANYLVADGKGFLAADESTPTIGKRFDAINTESTETVSYTHLTLPTSDLV